MKRIVKSVLMKVVDFRRRPKRFKRRRWVRFGGNVTVGDNVKIGDYTYIAKNVSVGPCAVEIGRYCSIGPDSVIGVNVHPTTHASTSAVFYSPMWGRESDNRKSFNSDSVLIDSDVWIGMRSIVLPGVEIGRGAIVAAGAVVTRSVRPYDIVAGVPAKSVGSRFKEEAQLRLNASRWWKESPENLDIAEFQCAYKGQRLVKNSV